MKNYCKLLCILAEINIGIGFYAVIANAKIKWEVNTKHIIPGHPVTLKCVVPENTCPENYVRRWFGGPEQKLLCINYNSSNRKKYEMSAVESTSSFELTIYDFDESDIDCEYECSCGFNDYKNRLTVKQIQDKLKYPLDWWTIISAISLENDRLNVELAIYNVYPIPICRLLLNEAVFMENINFTAIYRQDTLFPVVNCTAQITLNQHLPIATVQIECFDHIRNSFSLVVNDTVQNVGKYHAYLEPLLSYVIYIPICSGVIVLVILVYCLYSRKRKIKLYARNKQRENEENKTTYKYGFNQIDQTDPKIKEQPLLDAV